MAGPRAVAHVRAGARLTDPQRTDRRWYLQIRLADLDEHRPPSQPIFLTSIISCREFVLVSIDTSSAVHTPAADALPVATLLPRSVGTVTRTSSSCRTNQASRKQRSRGYHQISGTR
jgi:hypothetical protein